MKTTEQWVDEKVSEYNENPKETLENILSTTNIVIEQGGLPISTAVSGYTNTWNKLLVRFGYSNPLSETITILRKNNNTNI
jgi:hypothetical protein